jgi:hypothetical protein
LLFAALMVLPVVLVSVDKRLSVASIAAMILGFLIMIPLGLRSAFTQHKHGIFAQWTAPQDFMKMKLSEKEIILLGIALSLVVGGLIALAVQIKLNGSS